MQLLLVINSAQFTVVLSAVDIYGRIRHRSKPATTWNEMCEHTRSREQASVVPLRRDGSTDNTVSFKSHA